MAESQCLITSVRQTDYPFIRNIIFADFLRQKNPYTCILSCAIFRTMDIAKDGYISEEMKPVIKKYLKEKSEDVFLANLDETPSTTEYFGVLSSNIAGFWVPKGYKLTLYSEGEVHRRLQDLNGDSEKAIRELEKMFNETNPRYPFNWNTRRFLKTCKNVLEDGNNQLYFIHVDSLGDVVEEEKEKEPITCLDMNTIRKKKNTDVHEYFRDYMERSTTIGHCVLVTDIYGNIIDVYEPLRGKICSFEKENVFDALTAEVLVLEPPDNAGTEKAGVNIHPHKAA